LQGHLTYSPAIHVSLMAATLRMIPYALWEHSHFSLDIVPCV
jgi:hypothetical protein